jgi:hypothetical protein
MCSLNVTVRTGVIYAPKHQNESDCELLRILTHEGFFPSTKNRCDFQCRTSGSSSGQISTCKRKASLGRSCWTGLHTPPTLTYAHPLTQCNFWKSASQPSFPKNMWPPRLNMYTLCITSITYKGLLNHS